MSNWIRVAALALPILLLPRLALATQSELVPPTAGIYTGVQFSQKIGDAFKSLASCNKGPTAPANVGAAAVDGLCWIDDSVSPWTIKRYVNGGWAVESSLDPSTSSYVGVIGGGIATLSAGATVDLGSVPQANITISGTGTITSFGGSAATGIEKTIRFDSAAVLSPSNALLVPGGFPLTTAAGDRAKVTHLGSGNWEITTFTRKSSIPVDVSRVGVTELSFAESASALAVPAMGQALARTSYPAYLAAVTRAQNGTRTSGNATITGIANTDGLGGGMPVEGTGIAASCFIVGIVANTSITLNSSACVTSSGTSTVTAFLYGYGAGGTTSTVGVPDCRGRTIAGRDRNDPGTFANRLTSSYFGDNASIFGVSGNSAENVTMAIGNLISHQHSVFLKDPGHDHTIPFNDSGFAAVAGQASSSPPRYIGSSVINTGAHLTGVTIGSVNGVANDNQTATAGSASPTPMRTVPPLITAGCNVRVIP
jgi:hypothetical protein